VSPEHSGKAARSAGLQRGQAFNPYRMFTGLFIPEGLARCPSISAGAKLAWGRLARYAGHRGWCYPSKKVLAKELGVGPRQAQKYISELERHELLRRMSRFNGRGQTSNAYEFLWHELFEDGENDRSWGGENDRSWEGETDRSPKESHSEESQNIDLDSPPTNRTNRDSRLDFTAGVRTCKQYPRVREALADYMTTPDDGERVYPLDRLVVDVMDAAGGATEEEVIRCLRYLRDERGQRPGTRHGPRRFGWFKTVVGDYFHQKRNRETVYDPPNVEGDRRNGLSDSKFDAMTDAIEVDGFQK
jgi:hypothetical protein